MARERARVPVMGFVFFSGLQVLVVLAFYLLHLFHFGPLHAGHVLDVESGASVVSLKILFRFIILVHVFGGFYLSGVNEGFGFVQTRVWAIRLLLATWVLARMGLLSLL